MEIGALSSGLLTGLREGVEAALIVSIVLAYLARTGNLRFASRIWLGVVAAVLLSAGLGVLLYVTVGNLPQPYEQVFEGATLLVAAAVVTWMLFWMRRASASVKGELQAAVGRALGAAPGASACSHSPRSCVRDWRHRCSSLPRSRQRAATSSRRPIVRPPESESSWERLPVW